MPTKCCWVIHGSWPANAKLPPPHRHSSITRPCCSSAQTPSSLYYMHSSTRQAQTWQSELVDALGIRAVEVIICMITRDFSVILNDITGVSLSLSLSLYYSQKSLTHNIGSASALPIITELRLLHLWVNSSPVLLGCLGNKNLNLSCERCIIVAL